MNAVLGQLEDDILLTMQVITNAAVNVQLQVSETLEDLENAEQAGKAHAALAGRCGDATASLAEATGQLAAATRETTRETAAAIMFLDDAADLVQAAALHGGTLAQETRSIAGIAQKIEMVTRQGNLLALNASLEAARGNDPGSGFGTIASESKLLAERMRAASGELAQRMSELELAAAQNRLALEKMQGVAGRLRCALTAVQQAAEAQSRQGDETLTALQAHSKGATQLRDGAGALAALILASIEKTKRARVSGRALTGLLDRLSQRSVVFLRNSAQGNRRRLERVPVKAPGELAWLGQTHPVMTLELSRGGCVLIPWGGAADAQARPGAMALLRLESIGSLPITFLTLSELGWHVRFDEIDGFAAERIDNLISQVNRENEPAIRLARETAAETARALNHAIDTGEISVPDLLTADYRPVEGSDPVQYVTAALEFYERVLPPILDGARRSPVKPLFVVATDRNAYAPVHHPEFSQPQRPGEPVWNDLNARNRRIYDRWLTLIGARNRAPYSLRAYIRHRADGSAQPVQVIAAPVHVRGLFWGNVQVGCEM